MINLLKTWVNINSGSHNVDGLAQMRQSLQASFRALGAIETNLPFALTYQKRPQAACQLLLFGHMDTVFGLASEFQTWTAVDNQTARGPGVCDMKGGLWVMLAALTAFEQTPDQNIGWRVIINTDEELGSPESGAYIAEQAAHCHYALGFEPSLTPDGMLASSRGGKGKFTVSAVGKAAHVGRAFDQGNNAIILLAAVMQDLHALNQQRRDIMINVGRVSGGGALNVIPDAASCQLDVRVQTEQAKQWFLTKITDLPAGITITGEFTRPIKPMTPALEHMFELLQQCGDELGMPIKYQPSGGCCDGNNIAAQGVPVIDTLGVRGSGIHTIDETIILASLTERANLTLAFIKKLGKSHVLR